MPSKTLSNSAPAQTCMLHSARAPRWNYLDSNPGSTMHWLCQLKHIMQLLGSFLHLKHRICHRTNLVGMVWRLCETVPFKYLAERPAHSKHSPDSGCLLHQPHLPPNPTKCYPWTDFQKIKHSPSHCNSCDGWEVRDVSAPDILPTSPFLLPLASH